MDKNKWGVHESHCCVIHGCKYGDKDCPVVKGKTKQDYICEECDDEGIKSVEEVIVKSDGFNIINPNKMYAKIDGKLFCINGYKFSGDMITLYFLNDKEETYNISIVILLNKN